MYGTLGSCSKLKVRAQIVQNAQQAINSPDLQLI